MNVACIISRVSRRNRAAPRRALLALAPLLLSVTAAGLLAPAPVAAEVFLRFTPSDTSLSLNDTSRLSIWIDEPLELRTVEVWVTYDPAVLASLGGQKGERFTATSCYIWEGFEAVAPNEWHGYAIVIGSTCWVTGPGELYSWTFRGDDCGVSAITSVEARLYDPRANLIADVTLTPATVRVKDPASTAIPDVKPPRLALGVAPNPFNPRTQLSVTLGETGPVRVELFDLRGRRLATVWQGWAQAGTTSLQWDARDAAGAPLASGVYLLRLRDSRGGVAEARAILAR